LNAAKTTEIVISPMKMAFSKFVYSPSIEGLWSYTTGWQSFDTRMPDSCPPVCE